jgi:hypothetical protein
VVIKGHAVLIRYPHERFGALELPLFPRQTAPKHHFVRIEPVEISGRRFEAATIQSTAREPRSAPRAAPEFGPTDVVGPPAETSMAARPLEGRPA